MAKRKKSRKSHRSAGMPSAKLTREITAALEMSEEGEEKEAFQKLLQLVQRHPRSKPALLALLELCQELGYWPTFAYYSEQLLPLEQGEERAETLNNLVYVYIRLIYPALAWQYANEIITRHPDFEAIEDIKSFVRTTVPLLLDEFAGLSAATAGSENEKLERMVLYDRMRFYTESNYPNEAIRVAELLQETEPDSIPLLNNLSLSQFMIGNVHEAKATAHKVLDQAPDNYHALGNLVRYHFLTAEFDEAQSFAMRLKQVSSDKPDFEVKKAEAFAFLGDDEQVWSTYELAKGKDDELSPLHLHLAAAASYRLGDEKAAWKLWRQALKILPSFEMARECLADKWLPVAEREIPWYWSYPYWMPQDFSKLLEKHIGRDASRASEGKIERGMKSLLAERPYIPQLLPHMLERGDRQTREFALHFIYLVATPDLLQTCYEFALGKFGSDELRMEAIQYITENHPEMLPEDGLVPMWINGKQTVLMMLGFQISFEPTKAEGLSEEILDKHLEAYDLLLNDEPQAAELLLHEIMAAAPDFPSAYNQLAVAYEMQGQRQKARELVEETHARFPDYFFARVALARMLVAEGQIQEARDLVGPLLRQSQLHITEFRALAQMQMDMALAEKQTEAARSWLEMWRQVEPDNPEVHEWKVRIDGPGLLNGLQNLLGRSRDG
jgi:tetratricopeptide (TPR) repeat protein